MIAARDPPMTLLPRTLDDLVTVRDAAFGYRGPAVVAGV